MNKCVYSKGHSLKLVILMHAKLHKKNILDCNESI